MAHYLKHRGTRYPIRLAETTIGRSAYCPIVVANTLASRQHAKLLLAGGSLVIVDLESSNGTRVNGTLVTAPHRLSHGDIISIGTDLLEVEIVASRDEQVLSVADDDDDLPDTDRPLGDRTSILGTIEYLEAIVANARASTTPAKFVMTIRGALEHFLQLRVSAFNRKDARRLGAIVETLRSWCPDGSLDDWCARTKKVIDSSSGGSPPA